MMPGNQKWLCTCQTTIILYILKQNLLNASIKFSRLVKICKMMS